MYVTKRGDKYRAWERIVVNGTEKRISVTMDKNTAQARKNAQEALRAKQAELTHKLSDMTYSELVEAYIVYQKATLKLSTVTRNESTLKRLKDTFDDARLSDMTAGFIQTRLMKLTTEPGTYNEYLKRIKAMFRWAYRSDFIESSACVDKLKPLKDEGKKARIADKYLEADELKKVLEASPPYFSEVFEFLALSGLRIGELIALEDADVTESDIIVKATYDFHNDVLNTPKTESSWRYVHIQPELKDCIRRLRTLTKQRMLIYRFRSPYFVVSYTGGRLSYELTNRTFKGICERVTGRPLTLHALRHTHVSLLAENGADLQTISRRVGHADTKMIREIYYHVTSKQKAKDDAVFDQIAMLK